MAYSSSNGSGTLSAAQFKPLLAGLSRLGLDEQAIITASGLDRATLDDPLARIEAEFEHKFGP